jgi:hypothetical protein
MLLHTSGLIIAQSFHSIIYGIASYLPAILLALVIFIIGWLLASLIGKSIKHLIDLTRVDSVFTKTGVPEVWTRAGFRFSIGSIIGFLVKWVLILGVFLPGIFNMLGLSELNAFWSQIWVYVLKAIIAAVILVLAAAVARFAKRVVSGSAKVAGAHSANMAGSIVSWAIWIFAILIALSELGIAPNLIQIIFMGIVAMFALAGGLAFGLGGKEAASNVISEVGKMVRHE